MLLIVFELRALEEENIFVAKERNNFTKIVNYKIFIIACGILAVALIIDILVEQVPINLFRGILIVDLYAFAISLYYMLSFIMNKWYPSMISVLHVPTKMKKNIDNQMVNPWFIVISTVIVIGAFSTFFTIDREFLVLLLPTIPMFILFVITFIVISWLVIENMAFVLSGIYYVIYYRKGLMFIPNHEDGMGGSKAVLETFIKNIYLLFFVIIVTVTLLFHFIIGGWGFFGILVPFPLQMLMLGIIVLGISVIFLGIFIPQIVNYFEMNSFKKVRFEKLRKELKAFQPEIKKSINASSGDAYLASKMVVILLELEDIRRIKSILINTSMLKKIAISLIGFFISYAINLIFQNFFTI